VYFLSVVVSLIVNTSATDCLERLISEMACYVSSELLNSAHSLVCSALQTESEESAVSQWQIRNRFIMKRLRFLCACVRSCKCHVHCVNLSV